MSEMYITIVDEPDFIWNGKQPFHRSKIIVHDGWEWYLAEFPTEKALNKWLSYCGLEMKLEEEKKALNPECGKWRMYSVNRKLNNRTPGFWKREQVPEGAKPIRLHSNGSIVTGYILNDGETLHVYRPNPNAKEVYKPLILKKHIKYVKDKGGM